MAETDTRAMSGLQWGAWLLLVLQMLLSYWILWLGESHVPSNMFRFYFLMAIKESFILITSRQIVVTAWLICRKTVEICTVYHVLVVVGISNHRDIHFSLP
jgi:hypothetical protein